MKLFCMVRIDYLNFKNEERIHSTGAIRVTDFLKCFGSVSLKSVVACCMLPVACCLLPL
jgi:hypothetical protein